MRIIKDLITDSVIGMMIDGFQCLSRCGHATGPTDPPNATHDRSLVCDERLMGMLALFF